METGVIPRNFNAPSDILLGAALGTIVSTLMIFALGYLVPASEGISTRFKMSLIVGCSLAGAVAYFVFGMPFRKTVSVAASGGVESVLLRSGFQVAANGEDWILMMPDPQIIPSMFGHSLNRVYLLHHDSHVEVVMSLFFGMLNWRKLGVPSFRKGAQNSK